MKKPIVIMMLAIFLLVVTTPTAYADAGPSSPVFFVVGTVVTCACMGLGAYLLYRLFKKDEVEDVSSVHFDKEHVDISISNNEMIVAAAFEYRNTTDKELKMDLNFPFSNPIDDTIRDISLKLYCPRRMNQNQVDLGYEVSYKKIIFSFNILPYEKVILKVRYVELIQNRATYILSSIKKWKRPVSQATFKVTLPSEIRSPHFSYKEALVNREIDNHQDMITYHFSLTNLYPDKEFDIYWQ